MFLMKVKTRTKNIGNQNLKWAKILHGTEIPCNCFFNLFSIYTFLVLSASGRGGEGARPFPDVEGGHPSQH